MKKDFLRKVIPVMVFLLSSVSILAAERFTINEVTYEVLPDNNREVAVVSIEYNPDNDDYKVITIPAQVENNNIKYSVVELRNSANYGISAYKSTKLQLPVTVNKISPKFFMNFHPRIEFDPANPNFIVDGDFLMSKDKKVLLKFLGNFWREYIYYWYDEVDNPKDYQFDSKIGKYYRKEEISTPVIVPEEVKEIEKYAFFNNGLRYSFSELTGYGDTPRKFIMSDNVEKIGAAAFYRAPFWSDVKVPASVKELGDSVFYGSMFNSIDIDKSTTLKEIPNCTFKEARIRAFTIPRSIEKIGDKAFLNSALKFVMIPENVKDIGRRAFGGIYDDPDYTNYFYTYVLELIMCDPNNPNYQSRDDMLLTKDGKLLCCPYRKVFPNNTLPDYITSIEDGALYLYSKYSDYLNKGIYIGDNVEELDLYNILSVGYCGLGKNVKKITYNDDKDNDSLSKGLYFKALYITNDTQLPEISKNAFMQFTKEMKLYVPVSLYDDFIALRDEFVNDGNPFPENIIATDYPVVIFDEDDDLRYGIKISYGGRKQISPQYTPIGTLDIDRVEWISESPEDVIVDSNGMVICVTEYATETAVECIIHDRSGKDISQKWKIKVSGRSGVDEISEESNITNSNESTEVYTLQGQKVLKQVSELTPGIYIVRNNGVSKKIVVR